MKLQGDFLDRCCQLALKIQAEKGKKLKDFEARNSRGTWTLHSSSKQVKRLRRYFGLQDSSRRPLDKNRLGQHQNGRSAFVISADIDSRNGNLQASTTSPASQAAIPSNPEVAALKKEVATAFRKLTLGTKKHC